jgi:NAD-dependent aldehyde dehydrogenases
MIDKRKFYINGIWADPVIKNDLEVINPSNEKSYAYISLGSKKDVDLAVNAAKKAFNTWSLVDKKEKSVY